MGIQMHPVICRRWSRCIIIIINYYYYYYRPSDRVWKKIKNYVGIIRYICIMRKNMSITWKTHWIMLKLKQFITLIIVPFYIVTFCCYVNCFSEDPSSFLSV